MTASRATQDRTRLNLIARWRPPAASSSLAAAGVVVVVALVCLTGCRSTTNEPSASASAQAQAAAAAPAPPPSEQQAAQIRQELTAADPNVLIGQVVEVVPESQMAAVGNVDASRFKVHDTVVFIDAARQPQSTGEVLRVENGQLLVRYEPLQKGNRAPRMGDLAVRAQ